MSWQNEESESNEPLKWPTAATRLNWARNNYKNHTVEWKLQRFLVMLMNLIALDDLLEEEGTETFFTPKQKKEWRRWYEDLRPTRAIGRPRNGSETGPTE